MTHSLNVFSDLVRLETELWNDLDDRLRAAHELTMASYDALRIVAGSRDCRVVDIAKALAITVGGTSKLVDRLVDAGWAGRTANPQDRRSSVVGLTASGRALLHEAHQTVEDALDELLVAPLSPAELRGLGELLHRLRARYARVATSRVAP